MLFWYIHEKNDVAVRLLHLSLQGLRLQKLYAVADVRIHYLVVDNERHYAAVSLVQLHDCLLYTSDAADEL